MNTSSAALPNVLRQRFRCRILKYVVRLFPGFLAEKTGGSRPWPGFGRIGSSPALRTAAHAGPAQRDRALLSRKRLRGTFPEAQGALQPVFLSTAVFLPHGLKEVATGNSTASPASLSPGPTGGAVDPLRCPLMHGLELITNPDRPITTAASLLNGRNRAADSTGSGHLRTTDRTLAIATRFPPARWLTA